MQKELKVQNVIANRNICRLLPSATNALFSCSLHQGTRTISASVSMDKG